MAGKYQAYPEYKNSGVIGLDEIPANWHVQKIKFLFHLGRGRVISQEELVDEGAYPVYSSQTMNNGCLGYISTYDFNCTQITWTTDGANAGTVFLRNGKHNCTNVCGTLQPKNNATNLEYLLYCLQYVTPFYKRPDTNGAKIMNGEMGEIFVALPLANEQEEIANFLDHETAKIDALIEKQQQLIKLLKEKRQAVISHAVTKGLNPDAPMRDSGVEWLGAVPGHWKARQEDYRYSDNFKTDLPTHWLEKRLGYLAKEERAAFVDGPFGSDLKTSDYKDEGVPLIQLNNIRDSKHHMQNMKFVTEDKKQQLIRHLALPGDVVIAKMAEPVARSAIVSDIYPEYLVVADCVKLTPNFNLIDLHYLVWAINCDYVRINAELVSTGTTRIRINLGELKKLKIPYPPRNEQQAIANFLDHETSKIDAIIDKASSAIELMKERRTALISAAVTGKIDVRHWQAPASTIN